MFWKKLTERDRSKLFELMEATSKLAAANEVRGMVMDALIAAHPDPKAFREVLVPRLLEASLQPPVAMDGFLRKPYLDEIRRIQEMLLRPAMPPSSRPSEAAAP